MMSRKRIGQAALALMALLLITSQYFFFHDIYTVALAVAAAGALAVARGWKAWVTALFFLSVGLWWSSQEQGGCSFWWRTRYITDKTLGRVAYISWPDVWTAALGGNQCFYPEGSDKWLVDAIELVEQEEVDGHPFEKYKTQWGTFWIGEEGWGSLAWLLWEIYVYDTYQGHRETIMPGDTVIDAGAHIGVYTRYALSRGAARVIAIEPEPTNIMCLERNFADEIAAGQVSLVKAGIWNEESTLKLAIHDHFSTRPTLFSMKGTSHHITVPVRPLDDIVEELQLDRVDFIKMDIEGAERLALEGSRRTIERFRPRMAICTYHLADDPTAVPKVALGLQPDYRIHARQMDVNQGKPNPKMLVFN